MTSVLWLTLKKMRGEMLMYVIMLVMALVLTFIFSGAIFSEYNTIRVGVVNNDTSQVTDRFIDNIDQNTYTLEMMDADAAENAVAKGETLAAVCIPEGFGEQLKTGDATLTLIKTTDNADVMALENTLKAAAGKTAHVYALSDTLNETLGSLDITSPPTDRVQEMYDARMGSNAVAQVEKTVTGTNYDEKFAGNVHFLMGFNIFFVMFSIIFTIGTILEDKKTGTWNRTRITPLSGTAIFAGNMIPTFAVGVLQMAIVLFSGQFLFGIDLGNSIGAVFVVCIVFAATVTCLGLLLTMLFNTFEQLNAATPVILVATSMLGGCMWPLSIVPAPLQAIAKVTPQYWALAAAEKLPVIGGGLADAMTSIFVLLGMTVLFFGLSMLLYNKKKRV